MNYYNILLDTDIGLNLDDSLSLAYLLTNPNCKINGISISGNNLVTKAKIANAICRCSKKETPIYLGLEHKLPNNWYPMINGETNLSKWEHNDIFEGNYVDYMYSVINNNPYGVTIVTTGSLTNIANLFTIYPNCIPLIKELIISAGVFNNDLNNSTEMPFINKIVWSDIKSAKKVFNSPVKSIKVYGYELTKDLTLTKSELLSKCNNDLLKCCLDLTPILLDSISFISTLGIVSLFDTSLCTYKKGKILIEENERIESPFYGRTSFIEDETSNLSLAVSTDKNRFFNKYFELLYVPLINENNLFMVCTKINSNAYKEISNDYHIRLLKENELDLWKEFQFDSEEDANQYNLYMSEYYKNNYLNVKEKFFNNCYVLCDKNENILSMCLLWKKYDKYTTIKWFKVKNGYDRILGDYLLSFIFKGINDYELPIYLHTTPEEIDNIKTYTNYGFSFISKPDTIDNKNNDLNKCIPILQNNMNINDFNKLSKVDLSNYK